jgi:hypothetical protein
LVIALEEEVKRHTWLLVLVVAAVEVERVIMVQVEVVLEVLEKEKFQVAQALIHIQHLL